MAFQIKDFVSIVASMINHMRGTQTKITDFQPGSVARTLVEAPAVEIEELYMQMFIGLREAIPVATFQSFGFDKYPAKYANGYVSISARIPVAENFVIPAGTSFFTEDGRGYTSSEDTPWNVGTPSVTIPVIAAGSGAVYNVAGGEIVRSSMNDLNLDFLISNQPITNGEDEENDEAREARFSEYVASLSRGTEVACKHAARQATVRDPAGDIIERVTRLGYTEIAGYFKIYIYSNLGIASPELIADAQMLLDGRNDPDTGLPQVIGVRAAGIRGDILAMSERQINMTIAVRMRTGTMLGTNTTQSLIDTYSLAIRSIQPGETLLIERLRSLLLGVRNVMEVTLSSSQNITCEQGEALVPGNVQVRQL